MSQKTETQILTDLADLKRQVDELERWKVGADLIINAHNTLLDTPAPECDCRGWTTCPEHTPAPAGCDCMNVGPARCPRHAPAPAGGKRWTLFRDGGPWQVCPTPHVHGPDNGNMIVEHIEVCPAADLDAREELWAGRDRRQEERLAAAEAREKGLLRILELDGWSEEQIRTALAPEKEKP